VAGSGSSRRERTEQQPDGTVPMSGRAMGRALGVLYLSGATLALLWT